ncbi:MAG: preprotein translocase subunit SecG [Proteobacteria bacterium]|nr:preprotein translocase subunit SecG [Pseudomonadota bacterium]
MLLTIFNIFYVLVAIGMCVLILLQRGDGAAAGSGFGGGASATVFGARGATTFLSRATAVLAAVFFILSIAMGIYLHPTANPNSDLGIMSGVGAAEPAKAPVATPAAPVKSDVPAAPAATSDKPAATPAPVAAEKKDDAKPEPKKN